MNKFRKFLIPVAAICLLLATLVGCNAPLGEIFDPSGNPFAHRFSDVTDYRTATYIVAASDSVHKYEADYMCDGTNDHVQIQAAIDALPATGGEVFLLDGTYNLGVTLTLDSYQTLRGCGRNTILTGTTNWMVCITATGGAGTEKEGIYIADMTIDCDKGGINADAIYWTYVDRSKVFNVHIQDAAGGNGGIYWLTSDHDVIESCSFYNCSGGTGAILLNTCNYAQILGNIIERNDMDYLYVDTGDHLVIADNSFLGLAGTFHYATYLFSITNSTITGNSITLAYEGIYLESSPNNTISGNAVHSSTNCGIYVDGSDNCSVTGNSLFSNGSAAGAISAGIYIDAGSDGCAIVGNTAYDSHEEGIFVDTGENTIEGNVCYQNGKDGIYVSSADNNIEGNFCYNNSKSSTGVYHGITLGANADRCVVSNNVCSDDGSWQEDGINLASGADDAQIIGNYCYNNKGSGIGLVDCDNCQIQDNYCSTNDDYGIEITAGTSNVVRDNRLPSNVTGAFSDGGTSTQLDTYVAPFVNGTDPQDSGYLIDADTEYARAYLRLPEEVQQVLWIKVYVRSVILEADKMRLEFVIEGGADNEAYTTHTGSVANHPSTSLNFAADDIIYWTVTEAGVLALVGGDSIEVKVLHEAAGDGDCATDAYFRTVEIGYV